VIPFVENLVVIPSVDNLDVIPFVDNLVVLPSVDNLDVIPFVDNLVVIPFVDNLAVTSSVDPNTRMSYSVNYSQPPTLPPPNQQIGSPNLPSYNQQIGSNVVNGPHSCSVLRKCDCYSET
jgi:hypothetical protein